MYKRQVLGERYAGTFDKVDQHTTRANCIEIARSASDAGADLIVAFGGGSVVDAAKIVLMVMEHDIQDEAGFDPFVVTAAPAEPGGASLFRNPKVRMIAVPSTLNGGEFNAAALVTDTRRKLKQIFHHPHMMPLSIILDPALARHAPMDLWMGSGARAMDHGIEALCSPTGNPLVDAIVLAGIRYLHDGMLRTLENFEDVEARRISQYGTWLSASGLQVRVPMGASHGIGHVLGGSFGVPHFFCTPVMMPSILRFNQPYTADAQIRLAEALRAPGQAASDALSHFFGKLGLPLTLRAVGIAESQFEAVAAIAINHRFVKANPRPIKSTKDIVEILRLAA